MTNWADYFKVAQLIIMQLLELTLEKKIIIIKIICLFCVREIHDLLGEINSETFTVKLFLFLF